LRHSIPAILSAALAITAVACLLWLALDVGGVAAPGSGQQAFDAPGCSPRSYAGPSSRPHYLLRRNCPNPVPVVLHSVRRLAGGWQVRWDASRSYDPMGGRLVSFEWDMGSGTRRVGAAIAVTYKRPGLHGVVSYVTDDSGQTGTSTEEVLLP
jgi:PKD domain